MVKGSNRREFDFAKVYTNKSDSHILVVRINGVPMFTQYASVDRCVVVELSGKSDERLTSNRDGLVSPFRETLSAFVTELAVDKRSALKNKTPRYARFAGDRLSHISVDKDEQTVSVADLVDLPDPVRLESQDGDVVNEPSCTVETQEWQPGGGVATAAHSAEIPRQVATLGHEFILKNETDLVVPKYYRPDNNDFSSYSRKLIRIWGRLVIELHRMYDHESEFAVGFIFDDGGTRAEFEDGSYGKVYYINPTKIVEQLGSYSKSFRKAWKLTDRNELLIVALHEFIHGLGYGWHDESYANKLTTMVSEVMNERKRFNWCFK